LTTLIGGTGTRSVSMMTPPLASGPVNPRGSADPAALRSEQSTPFSPRGPRRVGEQLTALVAVTHQVLLVSVERLAPIGQAEQWLPT
jgi:hypothetical protein